MVLDRGDRLRVPETELFVDIQPGYNLDSLNYQWLPSGNQLQSKEKTPVFPETSVEFRDFPQKVWLLKGYPPVN